MKNLFKKVVYFILSLSLIGLIIIGVFEPLLNKKNNISEKNIIDYHQAKPNNLEFYQTVYKFKKKRIDFSNKIVISGVAPHHLLAGDLLAEFYSNLESQNFDTIILLSPNHFKAGKGKIISSNYDWQTPFGILKSDNKILKQLAKEDKEIRIEENIFQKEHGINSHVSFIKKTFPQAKFIPLVLSPDIREESAIKLAKLIYKINKYKKILLLASVDFSHYKNSKIAQKNDKISIGAISNLDFNQVYNLDIDSPASIYTLMKYSKLIEGNFDILNNSNSAILSGNPDIKNTTSYVTGFFVKNKKKENRIIKMLFFGDFMLDRYIKKHFVNNDYGKIFENVLKDDKNFFNNFDIIGANLEGTITNYGKHYPPELPYDFAFLPEAIGEFKKYNFNYFNLANNHILDQGNRGVEETKANLDLLNFYYSGCKDKNINKDCSFTIIKVGDKKIGLAGFNMVYGKFDKDKASKIINDLSDIVDFVVINIHWGIEYQHKFTKIQQTTAHNLIDAGADVIIGHHSHVVQGIEIYKKKKIFYSLGNFIFDQYEPYFLSDNSEGLAVEIIIENNQADYKLLPFKFKNWQIEFMDWQDRENFLDNIDKWSKIK
ncbi:MAG: AmmeMemoRadiSam system protein B [Patescibacteria group bacterium]|nr:AmmeMemoRadiSam system protein B [Patescibacteria group bacterium]